MHQQALPMQLPLELMQLQLTTNTLILGAISGTNGGTSVNVGIGNTAPSQRLHITGNIRVTGAYYDSNNDPGTNGQVLSTTVTGTDWVSAGNVGICTGGATTNQVTKFTGANEICNTIITDDGTRVGISSTSPSGKLNVVNSSEAITGNYTCTNAGMTDIIKAVYNQTSTGPIDGIDVSLTSTGTGTYTNAGVRSSVTSSSTNQTNIGVYGYGTGDGNTKNYGGYFEGLSNSVAATNNYGVYAKSTGGTNDFGGYFEVAGSGTPGGGNYAVYGQAGGTHGSGTNYYAGYFNGEGTITTAWVELSDMNVKDNILPIENNIDIINQLQPKSFTFRTDEFPSINFSEGTNYGLIAQEVEQVLPDIVKDIVHPPVIDSNGVEITPPVNLKGVNYTAIIPFLIGAIQEQQLQIDDLNSRLTSCCGPGIQEFQVPDNGTNQPSTINHQQLASVARDLPVLSQNQPNPFTEKTLIRFYIPKTIKDAAIKVFDNTGSVHRLFAITGEGPGTIELEANSLAAGNYYYSLLIGGNVIDTKIMVITK
jgi:hypothetical protein